MSCFRPIPAGRTSAGEVVLWRRGDTYDMELPCGRCIGCKLDRARMWRIRIMHEASLYDSNWFLTLTYDDVKLGKINRVLDPSLEYSDYQWFMRRLRKRFDSAKSDFPIRFFVAGEYGGQFGRPHFHAILFNVQFKDLTEYVNGTFRSRYVEDKLWRVGDVVIGSVTAESAAYVAGYTLTKVYGAAARDHYEDVVSVRTGELSRRRPEFVVMSRKPGIGTWWYQKYEKDLFPLDYAVADGKCYKVPRFYWEKFRVQADPFIVEAVENARFLRAAEHLEESTPERRAVREVVAESRHAFFSQR